MFSNNYISQFVPLPLDEIQGALAAKQYTQNQQLALGQELVETSAGWKADPVDAPYLEQRQKEIQEQVAKLTQQDMTQRDNQQALQNLLQKTAGDQGIQTALATARNRQAIQEQLQKQEGEAKRHDNNAFQAEQAYKQYVAAGGAAAGASFGEYSIAPYVDTYAKKKQYYTELKANGGDSIGMLAAEGGKIAYKNGHLSIDGARINQRTQQIFQDYLNSPEGKQEYNDALATGQDPLKYIWSQLQGTGAGYMYSQSSTNIDSALNKGRDEKKEKEAATAAYLPFGQIAPDLGEAPSFDQFGKVEKEVGSWEAAAGYYENTPHLPLHDRLGASLYFGLSTLFGSKEAAEAASTLLRQKETRLQQATALSNTVRKEMGLPAISEQQYFETNNTFRPQQAPVLQDKKSLDAAQEAVVGTGYFYNSVLYDQKGNQSIARDLIKEDDKVMVTTNPFQTWSTPFSPKSVGLTVTSKDGTNPRTYILDLGSHLKHLTKPRTADEAKTLNEYNKALIKHRGVHTFTEWEINGNTITGRKRQGIYDQTLAPEPLLEDVK